jgi:hypothetical protein
MNNITGMIMLGRPNPFNPALPPLPHEFVGRKRELKEFRYFLEGTLNHAPMNLVVTGPPGIGKTSFLVKCESLAKTLDRCCVVRYHTVERYSKNVEAVCKVILAHIRDELLRKATCDKLSMKSVEFIKKFTVSLKLPWRNTESEYEEQAYEPLERDYALKFAFRHKLQYLLEGVHDDIDAFLLMIDDVQLLLNTDGALQFLHDVFCKLAEERFGFMVMLTGDLTNSQLTPGLQSLPARSLFHPVKLKPLSREECIALISDRLSQVNVEFEPELIDRIIEDSEGYPYELIAIGHVIYRDLPLVQLSQSQKLKVPIRYYHTNKKQILEFIGRQLFEPVYNNISPTSKKLLYELAKMGPEVTFSAIHKTTGWSKGTISTALAELTNNGCLIKRSRGKYRLAHKMLKEYVKLVARFPVHDITQYNPPIGGDSHETL